MWPEPMDDSEHFENEPGPSSATETQYTNSDESSDSGKSTPLPHLIFDTESDEFDDDEPDDFYEQINMKVKKILRLLFDEEVTGPLDNYDHDSNTSELDMCEGERESQDCEKAADFSPSVTYLE